MDNKERYNIEQCTHMSLYPNCELCSAICPERYKEFKDKGVRISRIDKDGNIVDY